MSDNTISEEIKKFVIEAFKDENTQILIMR
jgi:hypothetical protein